MSYGNGTVQFLETRNKFRAYFYYKGKRSSKCFDTNQEALDWLAIQRSSVAQKTYVQDTKMTLAEWSVKYIETYVKTSLKYKTMLRYIELAKKLKPIANIPLSELTSLTCQQFINDFQSPSTRKKVYAFLHRIIKKATILRLIPYNIMDAVDKPIYRVEKKDSFTDEEMTYIKNALVFFPMHSAFIITAIATGCRIAELCGLQKQDIFPDHIHIEREVQRKNGGWYTDTPKSKYSIRDIAIPENLYDLLVRECNSHEYVFHRCNGEPYLPDHIQRIWKHVLEFAGVRYRNFHYIRHTHATNLLHQFDFVEVQHRLGHSQASTTLDMYGHTKPEFNPKIREAIAKMIS